MERPSVTALDAGRRELARRIARRLHDAGHGAWIVGGAVRDLTLGVPVRDLDFATPARPAAIEALFERTHAVGKAFGTILVLEGREQVQVTTFRADGTYRDGRHPCEVVFGQDLEADARRRDFTCNALYLDPLTDELVDPVGGLDDLGASRLRCVGDPRHRFQEDGLRLLRMVRFAAIYDLKIDPDTLAAARSAADSLGGVSAERIYGELAAVAERGAAPTALRLLEDAGLFLRAFPGLATLHPPGVAPEEAVSRRLDALARFGRRPDLIGILAILFDPREKSREPEALERLRELHPPRAVVDGVRGLWGLVRASRAAPAPEGDEGARRAARIRLIREPQWESVVALARAWNDGVGEGEPLAELLAFAASLGPEELRPAPFLTAADLEEAGISPGVRFGEILRRAEDLQLGGDLVSREQALRWLAGAARNGANPDSS